MVIAVRVADIENARNAATGLADEYRHPAAHLKNRQIACGVDAFQTTSAISVRFGSDTGFGNNRTLLVALREAVPDYMIPTR